MLLLLLFLMLLMLVLVFVIYFTLQLSSDARFKMMRTKIFTARTKASVTLILLHANAASTAGKGLECGCQCIIIKWALSIRQRCSISLAGAWTQ